MSILQIGIWGDMINLKLSGNGMIYLKVFIFVMVWNYK
jgi:hypothetical protein